MDPDLYGSSVPVSPECSYTVAYVDFFDEQIQQANGGWTEVVNRALFRGKEPLVNGIMGGR